MKMIIIIASISVAIAIFATGHLITNVYIQNAVLQIASVLLALGLGTLIVNLYLENKQRREAIKSMLYLAHESIAGYHDLWLDLAWAEFGRDAFGNIMSEYWKAGGKPEALSEAARTKIYTIYCNPNSLKEKLNDLEEVMIELSRLGGMSLDPKLLKYCLFFRRSVAQLRTVKTDNTTDAKLRTTELLLDIDSSSQHARSRFLIELSGIKDK